MLAYELRRRARESFAQAAQAEYLGVARSLEAAAHDDLTEAERLERGEEPTDDD